MYWLDVWKFEDSTEYEYKYAGNYGAKGEKRKPKARTTPEQIKRQNQKNKENRVRRLIKANFTERDLWITLLYPKGTRKPLEEVKDDLKKFHGRMRRAYVKQGEPYKYIYRVEVGKRGGIHIHLLINRINDVDLLVRRCWKMGNVNFTNLYDADGFKNLAEYITKPPPEELKDDEEAQAAATYNTSRNLIRPVPERHYRSTWTMKRILEDGPKPREGYVIDQDSIIKGVNEFTGYTYYRYTEKKIEQRRRE